MQGRKVTDVMIKTSANVPEVGTSDLRRKQSEKPTDRHHSVFLEKNYISDIEFCKQYFGAHTLPSTIQKSRTGMITKILKVNTRFLSA